MWIPKRFRSFEAYLFFERLKTLRASQNVSASELGVLLVIHEHLGANQHCWPSLQTIAEQSKYQRRSVIRILNRLRDRGILIVVHRNDGSRDLTNLYRINWRALVSTYSPKGLVKDEEEEVAVLTDWPCEPILPPPPDTVNVSDTAPDPEPVTTPDPSTPPSDFLSPSPPTETFFIPGGVTDQHPNRSRDLIKTKNNIYMGKTSKKIDESSNGQCTIAQGSGSRSGSGSSSERSEILVRGSRSGIQVRSDQSLDRGSHNGLTAITQSKNGSVTGFNGSHEEKISVPPVRSNSYNSFRLPSPWMVRGSDHRLRPDRGFADWLLSQRSMANPSTITSYLFHASRDASKNDEVWVQWEIYQGGLNGKLGASGGTGTDSPRYDLERLADGGIRLWRVGDTGQRILVEGGV